MRPVLVVLVACLVFTQPYSAATTQTVAGTIVDPAGAVLPGATVALLASDAKTRTTVTGADGAFRFTNVPIGRATLTVTLPGFRTETRSLELSAQRPVTLRIELSVSGVAETVTVTGQSPGKDKKAESGIGIGAGTVSGIGPGSGGGTGGGVYQPGPGAVAGGLLSVQRMQSGPWNTEAYDRIEDNAFHKPTDDPLSTFSIDVDTASYSNVRRFLNSGRLPPADAVRTEELINYFSFDYPPPSKDHPVSVTTEVAACPWNTQHRVALIGLHTREIDRSGTPPRNLVFLLDVSGSMMPADKLPLVKTAMRMLVDTLTASDRIAIVVYAGASGLVLRSTSGDRKDVIRAALDHLQAGGSTNGAAGIRLAYDTAAAHFIRNGINRVILATDGDFNVGVTSQGELIRLMEEERARGIFLSVLGVGTENTKDSTMEKLADKGNGNYAYLDSLHEARRVLIAQAGQTLVTAAKDVKVQVEFNPAAVAAYRLIGYENRILQKEDFNNDRKDAGEMGAGHSVTALYEIVPAGVSVDVPSVDSLRYQRGTSARDDANELMTVKIRYKTPDGDTSKLMTTAVRNRTGELTARVGFASAVAEFGMLLRSSEHKGTASWQQAEDLARRHRGADPDGYRAEFVRLLQLAASLGPDPTITARNR
jgi:Ca-activated chloride channel homolog